MLTEQIAREVARQLAPQAAESEARTPRPRPSTRDIPSEPSAASVVAPDDQGRAAGSLDARSSHEPHITPAYEPPGPYPATRELGQPAPRGARWQPGGEDSGPQAAAPSWQPPLSEEPRSEPEPQQATVSDSVWRAPAWLRPAEPAAARPSTPTWTAPIQPGSGVTTIQPEAKSPSWAAPAQAAASVPPAWSPPAPVAEPPAWTPEPTRARTPRIPELGLEPEPAPAKPDVIASYPKDDEEFVDGGFADEFEDEFEDRPAARVPAVEAKPKPAQQEAPPADPRPRAKPPKDADDDDFDDDDDDDDDFDDDDDDDDFGDDDDDERGSMAGEVMTSSIAAPVQPRKLPWIPIALVASVLVMISAYVFRDAIFGGDGEEAASEEETEVAENQPEVQPEPEPEPEPKAEPKPEPPPPAIPEEELAAKIEEATKLLDRQKHADAAKIVDEILSKIPKEPRALALRAFSQLEKRKHDEALATANECLEIDPKQATCWITIAVVEQETNGNLARSLEGYRKYLELEPNGRYAKVASGQVERLSKKVEG